ncbi:MAG: DUF4390 domain-containing protein [Woeseia sp.]|nr:DUF4390 domain-containing protein [Woeseia sp.]MBT8097973.1 DUF4390 domain-containing protein [Woeseia sp.]
MTRALLSRCLVAAVLLSLALGAAAQSGNDRQGFFSVRSASTRLLDGVHVLDARLQLVLSDEALDALNNGVALTIELRLEVIRVRRFMPDALDADLDVRYELEYRPLSQRYIVRNLNSGHQDSFATLYSALNSLGRIDALPIVDDAILEPDARFRMRLKALLSTRQYPAPLRMLFFWRDQWQLQSEWFEWQLDR